jgi:hypothetical protein
MKATTFDDFLRQGLVHYSLHFQPPADGRERLLEAAKNEGKSVLIGSSHLSGNTQQATRTSRSTILAPDKEK